MIDKLSWYFSAEWSIFFYIPSPSRHRPVPDSNIFKFEKWNIILSLFFEIFTRDKSNSLMFESSSPFLESNSPMFESNSPMFESNSPLIESNSGFRKNKIFYLSFFLNVWKILRNSLIWLFYKITKYSISIEFIPLETPYHTVNKIFASFLYIFTKVFLLILIQT